MRILPGLRHIILLLVLISTFISQRPAQAQFTPRISVSSTSLDFGGGVAQLSSRTLTLNVRNLGLSNLSLQANLTNDGDSTFQITQPPSSILAPLASSVMRVTFTPVAYGVSGGEIELVSNDPDNGNLPIALSGYGMLSDGFALAPPVSFSLAGANSVQPLVDERHPFRDTIVATSSSGSVVTYNADETLIFTFANNSPLQSPLYPGLSIRLNESSDQFTYLAASGGYPGSPVLFMGRLALNSNGYYFDGFTGRSIEFWPQGFFGIELNNDGWLDFVAFSNAVGDLRPYLNTRANNISMIGGVIDLAGGLSGMATSDFDGDSNQDLVFSYLSTNQYGYLFGNGDGTFNPIQKVSYTERTRTVAAADFDNDGYGDFALFQDNPTAIRMFRGKSDRTFQDDGLILLPDGVALDAIAGDFDYDWNQDIIYTDGANNTLITLMGDGAGGFQASTPISVGAFPERLIAHDFDHDGDEDIMHVNSSGGSFSYHENLSLKNPVINGPPDILQFEPTVPGITSRTLQLTVRNIGGSLLNGALSIPGDGPFSILTPPDFDLSPFAEKVFTVAFDPTKVGSFTRDLVVTSNDILKPSLHVTLEAEAYSRYPILELESDSVDFGKQTVGNAPKILSLPIKNVGLTDLILNDVYTSGAGFFVFDESFPSIPPGETASIQIGFDPQEYGNISGTLYLETNEIPARTVTVSLNGAGRFWQLIRVTDEDFSPTAMFTAAGEFNGSPSPELVFTTSSELILTEFSAFPNGTNTVIDTFEDEEFKSLSIADFTGDQKQDIVVSNWSETSPTLVLYAGNGDGSFGEAQVSPITRIAGSLIAADYEGDGDIDLFGTDLATILLLNDGSGNFVQRDDILPQMFVGGGDVLNANSDNKKDLLLSKGLLLVLLKSDPDSESYLDEQVISSSIIFGTVEVADINSDGRDDFAVNMINYQWGTLLGIQDIERDGVFSNAGRLGATSESLSEPQHLASADFNNDGHIDFIRIDYRSGAIVFGVRLPEGGYQTELAATGEPFRTGRIAVVDLNIDGYPDVVITYQGMRPLFFLNDRAPIAAGEEIWSLY